MNHKLVVFFALLSFACSNDPDQGPASDHAQTFDQVSEFREDFEAARYSRAALDAAALDRASEAAPQASQLALSRALAHLWHVSEGGREPGQDPRMLGQEAAALPELFQRAQAVNPSDARIDCWGGVSVVRAGRQLGDEALLQRGLDWIESGVVAYPEFNLFCRALAYEDLPVGDPNYTRAVDALFETLDLCFGEPIDRQRPEITKYLHQATARGEKRVCWNGALAPHNAEGFYMYFGDLLVKQGELEVAKVIYGNATLIPEYDRWPYKALLEERLSSDLAARAALYRDGSPNDDPAPGGNEIHRNCAYCHASSAEE